MKDAEPLLAIRDLVTEFRTRSGPVRAVDGISLEVKAGETVALVGESGCGKTTTAFSILRLIPPHRGGVVGGQILFEGEDLARMREDALRRIRGNRISMIFQEPGSALNPLMTIGEQISEGLRLHRRLSRKAARSEVKELLHAVRIPEPHRHIDDYPHRLSGGMRQRVVIAIALACRPRLLIADEPTTALDVTVQAQILSLIDDLKKDFDMSVLLITHDLAVVAQFADRVAVMYAGRKAEEAPTGRIFAGAAHPYTQALLASIPKPRDFGRSDRHPLRLREIGGAVPEIGKSPSSCAFADRCPAVEDICRRVLPPRVVVGPDSTAMCHFAEPENARRRSAGHDR